MKRLSVICIIAVISVLASGTWVETCFAGPDGDAKKAYESGDFVGATRILVEKLRKKADHQDNIALMEMVLPFAFKRLVSEAKDAESRGDLDGAFAAYQRTKALADEVSYMPPAMKEVKEGGKKQKIPFTFQVVDVTAEVNSTRQAAMKKHYDDGIALEKSNSWKAAAIAFRLAKQYDPNYQDAGVRYTECRDKAIFKVAVMPFDDMSGKTQFGNVGAMITENVISNAINSNPEFLQFVTRDYLNQLLAEQGLQQTAAMDAGSATSLGRKLGVQAFVFGKVLSVIPNFPSDISQAGENRTEVWVGKNDKRTLYAKYTMYTRTGSVKVVASYQIVDVEKGTILSAETLEEAVEDRAQWVKYVGDEGALPYEVKQHNTTGEKALNPPEQIAQESTRKLAGRLAGLLLSRFQ